MIAEGPCEIVYAEVREEHEDNQRFLEDVERWIGQRVRKLGNDKYERSIYEVFRRERYLVGIQGAPCTRALKRNVMDEFAGADDLRVLGYTVEEEDRVQDFHEHFPDFKLRCPLIERGLTKSDCLAMVEHAGIRLPAMYLLGYNNNNCVGCVKGGMGYWNKIRRDFPAVFQRMALTERQIGHAICRQNNLPVYLDELNPEAGRDVPEPRIDCSIMCLLAKQEYAA